MRIHDCYLIFDNILDEYYWTHCHTTFWIKIIHYVLIQPSIHAIPTAPNSERGKIDLNLDCLINATHSDFWRTLAFSDKSTKDRKTNGARYIWCSGTGDGQKETYFSARPQMVWYGMVTRRVWYLVICMVWYLVTRMVWYGICSHVWYCIKKRRIFRLIHSCQKCGQVQCSDDRWWVRTMLQTMLHTRLHCCTLLHTSAHCCTFHISFHKNPHNAAHSTHTLKSTLQNAHFTHWDFFWKHPTNTNMPNAQKNVIKLQCFDISDYSCRPGFDAHRESINSKQIVSHLYF